MASTLAARSALPLLAVHAALVLLSTIALTTFLAGPPPDWLKTPESQTALRLGWRFSGPAVVVFGALAALAHAGGAIGARRALALLVTAFVIALGAELLGTSTGYPFGPYSYTPLLGYRVAGLVPFPIPLSWFFMLYCALAICGRLLPARDDGRTKLRWAIAAGLVLTAWDVSMDPAMVRTSHWLWHTRGFFYGMPLSNWFGWLLTGTLVARVMLAIAPPTAIARGVSPSRLPLALYALNGVMPIALCVREQMWWAASLGTIAMAVPVTLAIRSSGLLRTSRAARGLPPALGAGTR